MRHATILVAILAFVPLASATAQVPVRPGERVRVTHQPICLPYTICMGHSSRHVVGTFVTWKADSLIMESNGNSLALSLDSVTKLEVSRERRLSTQGAAIGAVVGGGLLLYVWGDVAAVASGAGLGALLGGSPRARRGAGLGLLIGGVGGAVGGLVACADVDANSLLSQGTCGALGAGLFGASGVVLGAIIGVMTTGTRWEEVPLDRLRLQVAPQRDGRFGLGLSVRF